MERNEAEDLAPLHELTDFKVAEGSADVRGWEVVAADGSTIGTVGEMLVDTAAMEVRYLLVKLAAERAGAAGRGWCRCRCATRASTPREAGCTSMRSPRRRPAAPAPTTTRRSSKSPPEARPLAIPRQVARSG